VHNLFTLLKLQAVAVLVVLGLFLPGAGGSDTLAPDPAFANVTFESADTMHTVGVLIIE